MKGYLSPSSQRKLLFWGLYLAFWTIVGLAFADYVYRFTIRQHGEAHLASTLLAALPDFYVWAAASPPIFWLCRRVPIHGRRWLLGVTTHVAASALIYSLSTLLIVTIDVHLIWEPMETPFWTVYLSLLRTSLWSGMLVTWGIIALGHAVEYARRNRQHSLEAVRLEAQLARAQLQLLRMQLQPHFLFNTLHAISTLMQRDLDGAERMLIRLADLLRLTLEHRATQEVPLRRELEFLERYLDIERVRFGDRLTVRVLAPPETQHALVPSLILQPIVENAIKHGIAPQTERGRIEIEARREQTQITLEVRDSGPGLGSHQTRYSSPSLDGPGGAAAPNGTMILPDGTRVSGAGRRTPGLPEPLPETIQRRGLGLANTRSRLAHLYGDDCALELVNREDGGLRVTIRLPLKMVDTDEASTKAKEPA